MEWVQDAIDWLKNVDWKFVVGDILIPIGIFVAGLFTGIGVERKKNKAKAKVKGDNNTVLQNCNISK